MIMKTMFSEKLRELRSILVEIAELSAKAHGDYLKEMIDTQVSNAKMLQKLREDVHGTDNRRNQTN